MKHTVMAAFLLALSSLSTANAAEIVLVAPNSRFEVTLDSVPQGKQRGPFGSGGTCPLQARVKSPWPEAQEISIEKEFYVPANVRLLEIKLALDNDAYVMLNGQDVGIGLVRHENCPDADGMTIDGHSVVPGAKNRLLIYGMNRGGESFLGVRVIGYTDD